MQAINTLGVNDAKSSVTLKASAHSFKRFTSRDFKNYLYLSLCIYYLGWMSCLISFERCQPSCEEHGTSEHYKKNLVHGKIWTTNTTRPPDYKSNVITTRPQLAWYKMELNIVHDLPLVPTIFRSRIMLATNYAMTWLVGVKLALDAVLGVWHNQWRVLKAIQTAWKTFPCFYPMRMKQCRYASVVIMNSVCDLRSTAALLIDRLYNKNQRQTQLRKRY